LGIDVTPYLPKSDRQLSQFAVKIRNFENFKLGTDFEKAHPVNVPFRERRADRKRQPFGARDR
jgi:hypothetical protein